MALRVGVVLSGCGFMDGTEIQEAVSVLVALDRHGAEVTCMAPDAMQAGAVNHKTGKPEAAGRNVLAESARIARGKVVDIRTVKAADLDALVFPGGFGAAKNLSTFAAEGANCSVNEEVARLVGEVHAAGKPIGLACIAPVLAARLLGKQKKNPKLTIGCDAGTAAAINAMGGVHCDTGPADVCVDETNRLATTPCYMNDVGPWTVFQGAQKLVDEVVRLAGR